MNTIELKNFRNFEHLDKMSLDGITMLVGTNNAGKSTITKACRLLGENLHKIMGNMAVDALMEGWEKYPPFDFSNVCGNFKRALSTSAKEEIIEFTSQYEMFVITIKVVKSGDANSSFADIVYVKIYDTIDECSWECNLFENPHPISKFTYSGKFLANLTRLKELKYRTRNLLFMEMFTFQDEKDKEAIQRVAQKKNMTIEQFCSERQNVITKSLNQFCKIEQQYEAITDSFSIELPQPCLKPFDIEFNKKVILDGVHTGFVDGEILDFSDRGIIFDNDTKIFNEYFDYLKMCLNKVLVSNAVIYIPANDATHDSYFRIDETYNTDYATTIINRFFKQNMSNFKWVTDMLKKLGIGEAFNIQQINSDFLYVTITKQGGEVFPLADMGKGAIQLFLKILHLSTLCPTPNLCIDWSEYEQSVILWDDDAIKRDAFRKDFKRGLERYEMIADKKFDANLCKKLVIIEEPEQNLHPALQSKLADLFLEVSKLGVNVLVETHSEYLVRRSQVLVAEAKYKDEQELADKCPFKVYYLPETGTGGKPYYMEYQTTGGFKRSFGEGFFDEAGKHDMIVLRNESSLKRR